MDEQAHREAAITRIKEKREFWTHFFVYICVNALLVGIWAVTMDGGHFWPMWSMGGWGIGLAAHAWETFRKPITEDAIRKEIERGGGIS